MSEEEVQDMLLSVEIDKRGEIDYSRKYNFSRFVTATPSLTVFLGTMSQFGSNR